VKELKSLYNNIIDGYKFDFQKFLNNNTVKPSLTDTSKQWTPPNSGLV